MGFWKKYSSVAVIEMIKTKDFCDTTIKQSKGFKK